MEDPMAVIEEGINDHAVEIRGKREKEIHM